MSIWRGAPSGARAERLAPIVALFAAGFIGSGPAAAQPITTVELQRYLPSQLAVLGQNAANDNRCQDYETIKSELYQRWYVRSGVQTGDSYGAWRTLEDLGCPPRRAVGALRPTIILGGGPTLADVPRVKGGTQFDPISSTEIPIARSADVLTGGGGKLRLLIPTRATEWGDWGDIYVDASGSFFDGSGGGAAPIGGNNVAFTYLFPNPTSGSTGIFAGATGQQVQINSDGHLIDVSLGFKRVTPLPAPPDALPLQLFELHTTAGFRYRNFDASHTINQQSLFFPDLNSQIDLNQDSHFFGAQFGVGLMTSPPGPEGGFVGGIHAFVAPGVLSTSSRARQVSHCGPCGVQSPEFDVLLQRNLDDSRFSVIAGGSVHLGYQFNRSAGIFVKGRVEHMTDVPFFQVPTTPTEQPIHLGHGSVTNASVMTGFRFVFDPAELVASDVRLKRDIAEVGRLANGLKLYRYRYLWSDIEYIGVMAQEVAAAMPEAVVRGADGYLRVDYARLGLRLITWDDWRFSARTTFATAAR